MQVRKKITVTYIVLSGLSTLLLCIIIYFLFKQNNEYYFIKRLQDRAKIVASIHYEPDPLKSKYYNEIRRNGLVEMIDEDDFVLKVHNNTVIKDNPKLQLPPAFYEDVFKTGNSWTEEDYKYYYAQLFNESGQQYMVIITAKDRRGNTTALYILRILIISSLAFILLAYFLGRFFAKRVIDPVARITREVKDISASNLHNRLKPLYQKNDTDEIADLARTFNDMLDRLQTSFELQANFINNASHELKTPITTIIAETEIALLKKRDTAEYEYSLQNINKQATRLASLTDGLLKMTQTGYDGKKQVKDIARIDELLIDVKADLDRLYPDNKINLALNNMPADASRLLLPCNKPLLELALSNIITNGVKYSDNNEVFVTLSVNNDSIAINITDAGIGIPPEDIPYLYEPFFRGKKASRYTGYGLGLPLAMKIIRMHNGNLTITSEPDKGTVASIIFKLNQ